MTKMSYILTFSVHIVNKMKLLNWSDIKYITF